jgi:hypothetical protein
MRSLWPTEKILRKTWREYIHFDHARRLGFKSPGFRFSRTENAIAASIDLVLSFIWP